MSITEIKKQARKLQELFPAHLAQYPDGGSLTACQDLIAKTHRYPSFHSAFSHLAANGSDQRGRLQNNAAQVLCKLHAEANAISKRIAEIEVTQELVSQQASEATWLSRGLRFIEAVLPLVAHYTASNQPIGATFFTLPHLEKLLKTEIGQMDWISEPLTRWMKSVPGYTVASLSS